MSDHAIVFIACAASALGCVIGFTFGWLTKGDRSAR